MGNKCISGACCENYISESKSRINSKLAIEDFEGVKPLQEAKRTHIQTMKTCGTDTRSPDKSLQKDQGQDMFPRFDSKISPCPSNPTITKPTEYSSAAANQPTYLEIPKKTSKSSKKLKKRMEKDPQSKALYLHKSDHLVTRDTIQLENGSRYTGQWLNGLQHGKGTQIYTDGSQYKGEWKSGRANGKGEWIHASGDRYIGNLKNDKAEGYGEYYSLQGDYKGNWKNDVYEGNGVQTWPDGTKVTAKFVKGKKQGVGNIKFCDGSSYDGEFKNDEITGEGRFVYKDGKVYEGSFWKGMMHGRGLLSWRDGRSYEGEYRNDLKHGLGVFRFADGRVYTGEWAGGRQDGKGELVKTSGEVVKGVWKAGKLVKFFE